MLKERFAPDDFRTDRALYDTFGDHATERAALWLLRFLQERDKGWEPFTVGEIREWHEKTLRELNFGIEPFMFHRLIVSTRVGAVVHRAAAVTVEPEFKGNDFDLKPKMVCTVQDPFVHALIRDSLDHLMHPPLLTGS